MVKLFIEEVAPLYACCDVLLTAQDIASASRFQNERRRAEHLAWRRVVRRELGRDVVIDYDEVGAPIVNTPNIYISVSHARECVAVAIADCRVSVDVELIDRDFDRVQSRYMSEDEASLSPEKWWSAAVWSAKEAMFKYYGVRGIELLSDLRIERYDAERGVAVGCLVGQSSVEIEISRPAENLVVALAHAK